MGTATSAIGTVTKGIGAWRGADAQRSSLDYQASVAHNNAILSQDKAAISNENGIVQDQNVGLKEAQTFGMQRANMAANGVDLGSGSPNNVLTSTKLMGGRDEAQTQTNAMREAWGYQTQASDFSSNASALSRMAGSVSPTTAAFTSLLGSATQVAPSWLRLNGSGG